MTSRPRLTLALLVRDEEHSIEQAIDSARRFADEVLVRDTGSHDATVERALGAGARVLRGTWHGDFAEARNALVAAATGDWVLMLDADEVLSDGLGDIPRLILSDDIGAFLAEVESPVGFGRVERTWAPRLFRRRRGVGYRYRVHEILAGIGAAVASSLRIHHRGFMPSRRLGKMLRNLALLQADLRQNPGDPYLLWCHGRELELLGRRGEADASLESMATVLATLNGDDLARLEFLPEAISDWAEMLGDRGEARLAVGLATRAAIAHPNRPLARFVHARTLAAAGREQDAASAARALLEPQPWRLGFPAESEVIETHAPALLVALGA
jgi:glycosyltransferase involved in cell wall biosynthesis